MDSKEIKTNMTELNDDAPENVSGGLTLGCDYVCSVCGKSFTYTGSIQARKGDCCPYCGASASYLTRIRHR